MHGQLRSIESVFLGLKASLNSKNIAMKVSHVLMLTIATSVFLEGALASCKNKNKFGLTTKRINLRTTRRCDSNNRKTKQLKRDVKRVKALGRKLKYSIKALVADLKSTKSTNSGHAWT